MSLNIALISPDRKQGLTTVSAMIASCIAVTQNLSTVLTFTGNSNKSLSSFTGLSQVEDATRNLTQFVKLLEASSISPSDIKDYCLKVPGVPNLLFLDSASPSISEEENSKLVEFAIKSLDLDVIVTDVSTEIYEDVTKSVIEESDLVIMVLSQSRDVWQKLESWEVAKWDYGKEDSPTIMDKLESKGLRYIFNQYEANVEGFRDTTKRFGAKHTRCCKLSYSPFIRRMCNRNAIQEILPYVMSKDPRVIRLYNDFKEIMYVIFQNLGRKVSWPEE